MAGINKKKEQWDDENVSQRIKQGKGNKSHLSSDIINVKIF